MSKAEAMPPIHPPVEYSIVGYIPFMKKSPVWSTLAPGKNTVGDSSVAGSVSMMPGALGEIRSIQPVQ
jgi:hypothetical protein